MYRCMLLRTRVGPDDSRCFYAYRVKTSRIALEAAENAGLRPHVAFRIIRVMFGGKKRERRLEEAGQTAPARVVKLHRGGTWWVGGAHGGANVQRTNCRLTLEVQPPS
jgi:hypothetical protein